ncbi:MAG TPA: TonB-dependent receptor [Gemmatimonadales bacterium]|nr:TonB-dependent receptor [Gemmatimonadales bacterium]
MITPRLRLVFFAFTLLLLVPFTRLTDALAQEPGPTGSIAGRVVDEEGNGVAGAQVYLERPALGTQTRPNGEYVLTRVPAGSHVLNARLLGFRPDSATIRVSATARATQNFTLRRDPLQLQTMVVTGTQTPRQNLDASVAVTTLTATEVEQAAPRSTTEMLRYVPGFTRVESSGGEVNQNISMRGILGVEYVMFMEDGMPVFPTMHTYFMNADNLFRFDTNIERMEVVRGGASALFGSNTPGAIVNFINKTGGDQFGGTTRVTGGTQEYARYDLNINGPMGDDWRFNAGGFYRYDHGVRDPGFTGIRGGQLKANLTRQLDNGYIGASVKYINDRNQFILPLPLTNPDDPEYVPGFSNYGAMNTPEGLDLEIPTPDGSLRLPLDNGLRTHATWFTVDAAFDLAGDWRIQNTAQVMQNDQEWNALLGNNVVTVDDYIAGLELPAGTTAQLFYTNHFDPTGARLPYDNTNGLVALAGEWHVNKPISAIHDQIQLRRQFGRHSFAVGGYLAHYTQENNWNFTDVLTDVRDNPRFLDVVTNTGGALDTLTFNGFRKFLSTYVNGTGETNVVSGVIGGEIQVTDQLRADLGVRVEYNNYVQSSENTGPVDLDNDPTTEFNNIVYGNNTFRHFKHDITDWAGSLGLNYVVNDNWSVFAAGSRGYKMPALDDLLNASAQAQVSLFDAREVQSVEGGVKSQLGRVAFTVNGFFTQLRKQITQGAVFDPVTGGTRWEVRELPDVRSYGAELEAIVSPVSGLQLQGSATILEAELGGGVDSLEYRRGLRLALAPRTLGNIAATFSPPGLPDLQLVGDFHWVASRFSEDAVQRNLAIEPAILPAYNYFNFGASYRFPNAGLRLNVDLLNAFQSKGLEEGNPRLVGVGVQQFFVARPLLPRRVLVGLTYDFGAGGGSTLEGRPGE